MKKTREMKVLVEKAAIKLKPNEEIHEFIRELSAAGGKYVCKALGITPKNGGCWLAVAYSDRAVFSSYRRSANENEAAPNRLHMIKFSREKGKFSFSDMVEVERKIVYKPKGLKDAFSVIQKNKVTWSSILR